MPNDFDKEKQQLQKAQEQMSSSKSYEELCEILKKQFAPRVSIFKERIEFYDLKQAEKESVNEWFAQIKSKASNCKFGVQLDDYFKDRFVAGLRKASILDMPMKKKAALATSSKVGTVDIHSIRQGKAKGAYRKGAGQEKKKAAGQHQESLEKPKCVHCEVSKHVFAKCKYKAYKCKICNKVGHLVKICKSDKSAVSSTNLESEAKNGDTEIVDMYNLCNVVDSEEPLMISVDIEGQSINMELDTVKKGSRILMGKDLMKLLKIEIASLYSLKENISLDGLLQEYKDLFKDKLGKYKFEKIDLKLALEANPIFVKPRPIPLAFKEKVTVNKYLEDVKHPLPRIGELFAALSGGEFFIKLYRTAYNQLEVSEETSKLLAWSTHKRIYLVKRLPFGTKPACSIFQRTMEKVLQDIKNFKSELVSDRYLVHFNEEWKLKLVCDVSEVGIGAVLLHILPNGTEKPVAFASRILHEAEKNYLVIHKEALAIYWAANKFYQYLMDHKPLIALFGEHKGIPQMAAGRLQRWTLFLSGFRFEHIKGTSNQDGADGISRA
ncbi:PREDICTED: uncharacterized protein LOC108765750 [Trachymyrmex cornetzi]|uniref:uncharacterized protein LOC108765750 n=1 Tax=Trachymyrmex cornetzi TaxID=471704 RepID=UPI00084F3F85|nr:PREDICTED: uncharacterized protein LOC108765750 [Trachymyrmex cornetzi]